MSHFGFGALTKAENEEIRHGAWVLAERIVRNIAVMGHFRGSINDSNSCVVTTARRIEEFLKADEAARIDSEERRP
jgi:hypothetical protein